MSAFYAERTLREPTMTHYGSTMVSVSEFLGMVGERVIEEPLVEELIANMGDEVEVMHDGEDVQDGFESKVEVDEIKLLPPLSLC